MSAEIRTLHAIERQPVPDVVEFLEAALERAKRGDVIAVAIATANVGGTTTTAYHLGDSSRAALHYAMSCACYRIVAEGYEK